MRRRSYDWDLDNLRHNEAVGEPMNPRGKIVVVVAAAVVFGAAATSGLAKLVNEAGLGTGPSSTELLSGDLSHVSAVSGGRYTPPSLNGATVVHAFTAASDGFAIDAVLTSGGVACMVVLDAEAQLGTDHASTCADIKDVGNKPLVVIAGNGRDGELAGIAPADATRVSVRFGDSVLAGTLRDGYWAAKIPASAQPDDAQALMSAIGGSRASFS
jgi:hypothetical protein